MRLGSHMPTGATTYYIPVLGFYKTLSAAKRDAHKRADKWGDPVVITKYVEKQLRNGEFRTTQKLIKIAAKSSPKLRKAVKRLARENPLPARIPSGKKLTGSQINWVKQNKNGTVTVSVRGGVRPVARKRKRK